MFLNSFNYFRGISILFIVAGHTFWIAHWGIDQKWERFINNMISGSTVLFVFISGYLFHHIFYPKYNYSDFIRKKLRNIYLPYLILSTILIFYYLHNQSGPFADYFFNGESGLWNQYLRPAILYLWNGGVQPPYWYIPFILLTFLISPFHVKFIETDNSIIQSTILMILLSISMILHRPINNLNPVHAVGHFSSAYFLGIYCSIHRDKIYNLLQGKEFYLLIPAFGLAAFQVWRFPTVSLFAKPAFQLAYPDILFLQKIFLCFFFMVFFHRFENHYYKGLDEIAKSSFAIYFLHCFVIKWVGMLRRTLGLEYTGNIVIWIVVTIIIVYLSYLLAILIKKILPNGNSRLIIGY